MISVKNSNQVTEMGYSTNLYASMIAPAWKLDAACRGKPSTWFWRETVPEDTSLFDETEVLAGQDELHELGLGCCAICPVRDRCEAQYVDSQCTGSPESSDGIWGGQKMWLIR